MSLSLVLRFKQPATIQVSDGIDEYDIEHFRTAPNPKVGKWANVTIEVTDKDTAVVLPTALRGIGNIAAISGVFATRTNNGSQIPLPAEYQNLKDALHYFRNAETEHRKDQPEQPSAGRPNGTIRILEALQQYTEAKAEQAKSKGKQKSVSGEHTAPVVKAFIEVSGVVKVNEITAESIATFARSLDGHNNTQRTQLKKLRAFCMAALFPLGIRRYVMNDYAVQANRSNDEAYAEANRKVAALFGKTIKAEVAPDVEWYSRGQIEEMRATLPENTFERVAMELYLQTGLRAGEGTHLLWANTSIENRTVKTQAIAGTWTSKTGEYRTVRFGKSLQRILKAWKEVCPSSVYVLGTGDNDPQDFHAVRGMLQTALPSIDVNLKRFRSTFACYRLWAGDDPVTVSKMLGHTKNGKVSLAGLATTIKYLEANPDRHDVADKAFGD